MKSILSLVDKKLLDICCVLRSTEEVGGIWEGHSPYLPLIAFMHEVVV